MKKEEIEIKQYKLQTVRFSIKKEDDTPLSRCRTIKI